MSCISGKTNEDGTRIELPVFLTPTYLSFALNKRKSCVTIFNPYENDAHFKIFTTSPQRYDVNVTKGTIKPQRCIDISIRLLPNYVHELQEPEEEPQIVDSFRITLQMGNLRGNRAIQVTWCIDSERAENPDAIFSTDNGDTNRLLYRTTSKASSYNSIRTPLTLQNSSSVPSVSISGSATRSRHMSQSTYNIGRFAGRPSNPMDRQSRDNSNVNLICFICSLMCALVLLMPLSIDCGNCNKTLKMSTPGSAPQQDQSGNNSTPQESVGWIAMAQKILAVSYEMKICCSFALGLFTYRLISTLPD